MAFSRHALPAEWLRARVCDDDQQRSQADHRQQAGAQAGQIRVQRYTRSAAIRARGASPPNRAGFDGPRGRKAKPIQARLRRRAEEETLVLAVLRSLEFKVQSPESEVQSQRSEVRGQRSGNPKIFPTSERIGIFRRICREG